MTMHRSLLVAAVALLLILAVPSAEAQKKAKKKKQSNKKTKKKTGKKSGKAGKKGKKKGGQTPQGGNQSSPSLSPSSSPSSSPTPMEPAVCGAPKDRIGDGWCDYRYNTELCSYDGGDCCEIFGAALFDCRDPSSPWFDISSPTATHPAPRNSRYDQVAKAGMRLQSSERLVQSYNNYYEFTFDKVVYPFALAAAPMFDAKTWQIEISGLVNNPMTISAADLMSMFHFEERLYRHRCVEAWSIVVPWTGFELNQLVELADPKEEAIYVKFTSWYNPKVAKNQLNNPSNQPWPYVEGLTIEEARNELAFLSTGQYGKALPPQSGAPLRLTIPWKYGFKSIKAIQKIEFVAYKPENFWKTLAPLEYGFFANVNPAFPHPRWSQATERQFVDSTTVFDMKPTNIYNGYKDFVEGLYTNYTVQDQLFIR